MQYGNLCREILLKWKFLFKSYYVVWKPEEGKGICRGDLVFKSYYVVWKPNCPTVFAESTCGLNRTMQYGNLLLSFKIRFEFCWFKSYYVVWKRRSIQNVFSLSFSFKSYYVVWKLQSGSKFTVKNTCLNRTMQYGNRLPCGLQTIPIRFKSYYVVWKRVIFLNTSLTKTV